MPKIDMEAYRKAESFAGGGSYARMVAGGYIVKVQAVRTKWHDSDGNEVDGARDKQYVKLIYDIAEGPFADGGGEVPETDGPLVGKFSDEYWAGEDRDYAHWICLSWKNLGALKGMAEAFDGSNDGFDFMAAFDADKWDMFIGRTVGIVVGEEETGYDENGRMRTRLRLPNARPADAIREGRFRTDRKSVV